MSGQMQEPLSKRLGRFVALMGIIFFITAAVVLSQRLSSDSLALLVGLSCGVSTMSPTVLLGIWLWRREESKRHTVHTAQGTPPVVVVTPQALPTQGQQPALTQYQTQPWAWQGTATNKRNFTIVGGEE